MMIKYNMTFEDLIYEWQNYGDTATVNRIVDDYKSEFTTNEETLYRAINLYDFEDLPKVGDTWTFKRQAVSFTEEDDFHLWDNFCNCLSQCNLWLKEHRSYYRENKPVVLVLPKGEGRSLRIWDIGDGDYEAEKEHLVLEDDYYVERVSWVDLGIKISSFGHVFIQKGYYKIVLKHK